MATVGGVTYMSPNMSTPVAPSGAGGNPLVTALSGFKLGAELGAVVEKQIDTRRTRREVDKLMSELKDGEEPTQDWFMRAVRYMGPDGAREIAGFHNLTRTWKTEDKKEALVDLARAIDFGGGVVDVLRQVPEEQRAETFATVLEPYARNPEGQELIRPLAEMFQDGDFADDRLDALTAQAAAFGRYQKIHDNRLKAGALKEKERLDREAKTQRERIKAGGRVEEERVKAAAKIAELKLKNPPPEEIVEKAQKYAKLFGGRPGDWGIYLRSEDKMIGEGDEGFVSKTSNKALNLGSFNREYMAAGDPLAGGPVAGSPATIKRNPRRRR